MADQPIMPALDHRPQAAELRGLSPAFRSIEDQLSAHFPEAIAKLRDPGLDYTRAQVSVKSRGGKQSPFEPLADFVIVDFADSCAVAAGKGGPLSVIVEPNDGVRARFSFGFVAPEYTPEPATVNGTMQSEIQALRAEIRQQQQLAAMAQMGGGGGSKKEWLEEMALFAQIIRNMAPAAPLAMPAAPAADPTMAFVKMAEGFGIAAGAVVNTAKNLATVPAALNPSAAKVEEIKAWTGAVKEIAPVAKDALVMAREVMTTAKPAGETSAAAAAVADVA